MAAEACQDFHASGMTQFVSVTLCLIPCCESMKVSDFFCFKQPVWAAVGASDFVGL